MGSRMVDVGLHQRLRARDMEDPEYRAAYERAAREIAQTDAVIRALDTPWAQRSASSRAAGGQGSRSPAHGKPSAPPSSPNNSVLH